jgi:DNA-binding PadR family transcriptional regulator
MHDLTAFRRDILYVIAGMDDEPYGLAIKNGLEEYYGEEVEHGHLYPNLDALVEEGFVEKGTIDERTNSYTLSDRARREIRARREWEDQHIDDVQVEQPTA